MAEQEQKGIKWWKCCSCCKWEGNAKKAHNDNTVCPNCGQPLTICIDEKVFNGRRYDHDARADNDRAAMGRSHRPDTVSRSDPGHPRWRT